jgi:hypothetical protein
MSCALSQGFVLDCRDGIGGVKEFFISQHEGVTLTVSNGVVTGIDGATWFEYDQYKNTSEIDEQVLPSTENGTNYIRQTVKLVLNKREVSVRNEIMILAKARVMIIEVAKDGRCWLFGADTGLALQTGTAKSGKAAADRSGYEIEFEGIEPELAYEVSDEVMNIIRTGVPSGPTEFSGADFSSEFN